jgi:DNA-binding winged helix-turn-helix (wHTH) protein/TolB-like protein/predicted negative regulator of RcsB-dependent stress response
MAENARLPELPELVRFGEYEADLRAGELTKRGVRIRLAERPFRILCILLREPGRLVPREQLRQELWPADTFVDYDHGISSAINKLRQVLCESAENPRYIETVGRRGYRFIAKIVPVSELGVQEAATLVVGGAAAAPSVAVESDPQPLTPPTIPLPSPVIPPMQQANRGAWQAHRTAMLAVASLVVVLLATAAVWRWARPHPIAATGVKAVAVIEFQNFSQDSSLDWLGDGVEELLTTNLATTRKVEVISTERVRTLLRRRNALARVSLEQATEVAQDAHADVFISGAILRTSTGLRLDVRAQETSSGRTIFAGKFEGNRPEQIFEMVDAATSELMSQIEPGQSIPPINARASLTSNLEALHSYATGLDEYARVRLPEAAVQFRRATELDSHFAMAYYKLANSVYFQDQSKAREAIAYAARLAQTLPIPREHKLAIDAANLRYGGRFEEAKQLLEGSLREFPRAVDLRLELANIDMRALRAPEGRAVLEEVIKLDPQNSQAYNYMSYAKGYAGDMTGALEANRHYAAMLPPNDPNILDSQGDLWSINGNFEQALAAYSKNLQLNPAWQYTPTKVALAALHSGQLDMSEQALRGAAATKAPAQQAERTSVLGDIAAARGRFDEAAKQYEQAASLYEHNNMALTYAPMLKIADIYLQQGEAKKALEIARRHTGPWASGLAGIAEVVLGDKSAAEQQFSAMQAAILNFEGEYVAQKNVQLCRFLGAAYAKDWKTVIATSQGLTSTQAPLFSLALGRAYLETGMLQEAGTQLNYAARAQFFWTIPNRIVSHNLLASELAVFYLARFSEKRGDKAAARDGYTRFLQEIGRSPAWERLPEVSEARLALKKS